MAPTNQLGFGKLTSADPRRRVINQSTIAFLQSSLWRWQLRKATCWRWQKINLKGIITKGNCTIRSRHSSQDARSSTSSGHSGFRGNSIRIFSKSIGFLQAYLPVSCIG